MDAIWSRTRVDWQSPDTWRPQLSRWLAPRLDGSVDALRGEGPLELCWDDDAWDEVLDDHLKTGFDDVANELARALAVTSLLTFHGCRVEDAGVYSQAGLRRSDHQALAAQARAWIADEPALRHLAAGFDARLEPYLAEYAWEDGRAYLAADDRFQVEEAGHYALYGSEWTLGLLGASAMPLLLRRGVPTFLRIEARFAWMGEELTSDFATQLLREWTRQGVNGPGSPPRLDFGFSVDLDIPPERIVGHTHPPRVYDDLEMIWRASPRVRCPGCAAEAV